MQETPLTLTLSPQAGRGDINVPTLKLIVQSKEIKDEKLMDAYKDVTIEVEYREGNLTDEDMEELKKAAAQEGKAVLVLDESITTTKDAKDIISPWATPLMDLKEKEDLKNKLSYIEGLSAIIDEIAEKGRITDKMLQDINALNLNEDELINIAVIVLKSIPAIAITDLEDIIQGKAAFMPARLLEDRPDLILNKWAQLKENRPNNTLLVSGVRREDKSAYIESVNRELNNLPKAKELSGVDIKDVFEVLTYEEALREFKVEDTQDAVEAAETLIKKIVEHYKGEVQFVGGVDIFKDEVKLGWLITGVLQGTPVAIREALNILGQQDGYLKLEDLRGKVLDLRGYTTEVETYRRAVKELKQAL